MKTEILFESFHENPLGSASIGQVHYAVLKSGEPVAVKVQRPDIEDRIKTDLEILKQLAVLAEFRLEWAVRYQVKEIVEDRKSTRLNSSHVSISYAVFCLKKKRSRKARI